MTVERVAGGEGVIAVPTRFLRNWVATHYADKLLAAWRSENRAVNRISFIVDPRHEGTERLQQPAKEQAQSLALALPSTEASATDIADDKGQLSAPLDPRLTFENFIPPGGGGSPNMRDRSSSTSKQHGSLSMQLGGDLIS